MIRSGANPKHQRATSLADAARFGVATLLLIVALFSVPRVQAQAGGVPVAENLVDLATVLQLAQRQNPTIGLAAQSIEDALARQQQARALMLPTLRAGANYRLHQGVIQSSTGQMLNVTSSSLYLGSGAGAVGAGTVAIPGVQILGHVGDGIFEPLAARQLVFAHSFGAQATVQQTLLEVSRRFFDLARAEAELQAVRQSAKEYAQAVDITEAMFKARQGREADALRARTASLLLRADEIQAKEEVAVASAELARVLSLDPSVRLRTMPQPDLQLVDARQTLAELLQQAENARPEIAAQDAEIARKAIQVRQERLRPFLPTLALDFSAGSFGGGTNRTDLVPVHPEFGRFAGRSDFDAVAYWTLQNMGMGNLAAQRGRRAEENQAMLERDRIVDLVRREVTVAHAQVESTRRDLAIARRRLEVAQRAFDLDLPRIRNVQGLPIELLNSLDRLAHARRDVQRIIADFNVAQMELFTAIGR